MTEGCGEDDYKVTISGVTCSDLDLTQNALSCYPPENEPDQTEDGLHPVRVSFVAFVDQNIRSKQ